MTTSVVLLALDLDAEPDDLEPIVDLVIASKMSVHLLHVTSPRSLASPFAEKPDEGAAAARLDEIRAWLQARSLELEVEVHIVDGPVIDTILSKADELGAAMIVIVATQRRRASRPTLGSVSGALLKVAHRPVLVLPTSVPADAAAGFSAALDRLIGVIDGDDSPTELSDLRRAAEEQLDDPGSEAVQERLVDRLRQSIETFETDHPAITRAVNDVAYYLSGLGI